MNTDFCQLLVLLILASEFIFKSDTFVIFQLFYPRKMIQIIEELFTEKVKFLHIILWNIA